MNLKYSTKKNLNDGVAAGQSKAINRIQLTHLFHFTVEKR